MDQSIPYKQMLNPECLNKIKQLKFQNIIDLVRKNEITLLRVIVGLILPFGIIMITSISLQCKERDEIHGRLQTQSNTCKF